MLFLEALEKMNFENQIHFIQSWDDGDNNVFIVFFKVSTDPEKVKEIATYINNNTSE